MATQTKSLNTIEPQFDDSASCKRWIESLPLTNFQLAQHTLTQQISLARHASLPAIEMLRIMDTLREPVAYVQTEVSRKYSAKPLPLDNAQAALWMGALRLWQEMCDGYLLCRDAYIQGDAKLKHHGALILMHCLRYTAQLIFEHYRVYRQAPAALWKQLYQLYAFAEQHGFAQSKVVDAFSRHEPDSSCAAAFCRALLAQLANPYALSGRQLEFLARWIEKWSEQAAVASHPFPPSTIPAHVIDLATGNGPVFVAGQESAASLRYLDIAPLSRTLRQTITLLKQGQPPAHLGLGEDARQPGCENLLMLLYVQWCRAGTDGGEKFDPTEENAQVGLGMHAAHFCAMGRAFRAPGSNLTGREERDMQMFGRVSERTERMLASGSGSAIESWRVVQQGSYGFMCMLRETGAQTRISHNQLVAVRRGSSRQIDVGLVQWLRVEESSEMFVGVRLFPGTVRAVAMRPANFHAPSTTRGFEQGLLLPESAATSTTATLIMPGGWYHGGRIVEVQVDNQQRIAKLVNLLEKGSDFERCTVELE